MSRLLRLAKPVFLAACLPLAVVACSSTATTSAGSSSGSGAASGVPAGAVGIVDPMGQEQAPILAAMHVVGSREVDGYTFWYGTISGHAVIDVGSGEMGESTELATYLLDATFHPRLTVLCGAAGATNPALRVGDVVVSAFVVDKSAVHYSGTGDQAPYGAMDILVTPGSLIAGAITSGYGNTYPTPSNAPGYGMGPAYDDHAWTFVTALAADRQAVRNASSVSLPGQAKVLAGVVAQAAGATEPLSWLVAQDMLYQGDAEENKAAGFAFADAQVGIPWVVVRGISDSPWQPTTYDGVRASANAAAVAMGIVSGLPAVVDRSPATTADLSPSANAARAGYIVAASATYGVSAVTQVRYTRPDGSAVTLSGDALALLESEYTPSAGAGG